jgi:uncharacterized phage-associated protein
MQFKPYTANQIADWFISEIEREKGDHVSHLKIQKLVYYAQAWHYTICGIALFNEPIQAWKRGPVIRSVYKRFIDILPFSEIQSKTAIIPGLILPTGKTLDILVDVRKEYGDCSSSYLEKLTHREDPWLMARGKLSRSAKGEAEITLESMKHYYSARLRMNN